MPAPSHLARCIAAGLGASLAGTALAASGDWPAYGNDPGGMRFSPLTQIDRGNVARLQPAWTFHTGDIVDGKHGTPRSGLETTPIMVDGTLYLTTPVNRVIALDPATGKQRWAYDPKLDLRADYGDGLINRGVASWLDPQRGAGQPCRRRLYEATLDARLIALDAADGRPCEDFGRHGEVDLSNVPGFRRGEYHMTSPPVVVDGVVVVGSAINDNHRTGMPSGVVRGYDARSGALRWRWDPLGQHPAGHGGSAWRSGAANAWSIMVADEARGLVFVPTGSASPDYYGGHRPDDDRWANSVVALHAATGKPAWGFQLVHHDLWDYDTASPPLLATLQRNGRDVPVVVQGNKTGYLYVLDRDTGKPVLPVEERAVPQSDVPGEHTAPTQPIPTTLPPLSPVRLAADQLWGPTPADREACRAALHGRDAVEVFTPPSLRGGVAVPGNIGGMNWSGYAFDPQRKLLVVNTTFLPFELGLLAHDDSHAHGPDGSEYGAQAGTPYAMFRRPLLSPAHLPCLPGPWGELVGVDLAEGRIRWHVPLGSMQGFAPGVKDMPPGSPSLGGPIVTAGGLAFIAGTIDPYLRAFDLDNGQLLWQARLPTSGHATPMTYAWQGRQYVVIAAGGSAKITEEAQGDAIIAYALPPEPAAASSSP
ncbi:pyrroloquinoline quinone-dependent dehydrogenase [Frateuria defendens]|uniref:pyrroloquinoline quinone-dependent dehydrogenase n=1 Tax=Frateuria defendens TaxID=2219559 RepID=UPI00066FFA2D|nr:pyrroloquinoline quinone-dependent dehydrogenase [Frateuria defendens]